MGIAKKVFSMDKRNIPKSYNYDNPVPEIQN